uniref:RNase H type-1 domain-containing protein n=1 Tax=Helianthus annuus TaxID=4232 RepID=A0A251UTL5_HELAN
MNTFQACNIKQIPRSQNKKADALSKLASLTFAHLTKKVLVEVLKARSIDELEVGGCKTHELGIFLAFNASGYRRTIEEMRCLPNPLPNTKKSKT